MTDLVKYEAARHALVEALAEARSVSQIKEVTDKADAFRALARAAHDREMEALAIETRGRAFRRLGEAMKWQEEEGGGWSKGTAGKGRPKKGGVQSTPPKDDRPSLEEAGIDKNLAKHARAAFKIDNDTFEKAIKVIHKIAAEEPHRPLTLNLLHPETEYKPRRENVRGVASDSKMRLDAAASVTLLKKRVGGLERPVSQLLLNKPQSSKFLPECIKKLEGYLKQLREWHQATSPKKAKSSTAKKQRGATAPASEEAQA